MRRKGQGRTLDKAVEFDRLLTRDEFRALVLQRSQGACVLCRRTATEAHHVLDRKLYTDGGYYLGNGAAVCNECHWGCETTLFTVEAVRAAAEIPDGQAIIPEGLAGLTVDKWGNTMNSDGTRSWGPLKGDDGCRRALAQGGYLGYFINGGGQ